MALKKEKINPKQHSGYKKYMNAMANLSVKVTSNLITDSNMSEAMKNEIFDLDGPRQLNRTLSDKEEVFAKVFHGFSEVMASYENLLDIDVYIRQYPKFRSIKGRHITKHKYLRYHIERYFEEIYILKCRLDSYLSIISRYFKHDFETRRKIDVLSSGVEKSFEGILKTRGTHVHKTRFKDKDLERLSTIEMLSFFKKSDNFSRLASKYKNQVVYPETKKRWVTKINLNNKAVTSLLNVYFGFLYKLIFTKKKIPMLF